MNTFKVQRAMYDDLVAFVRGNVWGDLLRYAVIGDTRKLYTTNGYICFAINDDDFVLNFNLFKEKENMTNYITPIEELTCITKTNKAFIFDGKNMAFLYEGRHEVWIQERFVKFFDAGAMFYAQKATSIVSVYEDGLFVGCISPIRV
jgi:hypothetical protein